MTERSEVAKLEAHVRRLAASSSSSLDGLDSRALIDVVESIYDGIADLLPSTWLARTLGAVHQLSRAAIGGYAYGYDISGVPESWSISRPLVVGMPEEIGASIYDSFVAATRVQRRGLERLGPSGTLSEKTGFLLTDLPPSGANAARSLGVADSIHVNALDPNGRGVLVALTVEEPRRLAASERQRLALVAAHVAGARRLLLSGATNAPPVAIFEAKGTPAHVDPSHASSIPTLKQRLLQVEAMRNRPTSTDPTEVLASWKALYEGRYSLLGRIDSDGRRYVVAYENAPNVRDPRGLSPLEASVASLASHGHAQKYIAYELGLTVGTVGGTLARVYRKLRVGSRSELVDRMAVPTALQRASDGGAEVLVFSMRTSMDAPGIEQLTKAERAVAFAAADGQSNAVIARTRRTSLRTVEEQLGRATRKLGVASRAELAAQLRGMRDGDAFRKHMAVQRKRG